MIKVISPKSHEDCFENSVAYTPTPLKFIFTPACVEFRNIGVFSFFFF